MTAVRSPRFAAGTQLGCNPKGSPLTSLLAAFASEPASVPTYKFCAYSGIFSPAFSRTYAFFQSGR